MQWRVGPIGAWVAMVEGERRRGRRYERVGLFRLDVKYVTPIRIGAKLLGVSPKVLTQLDPQGCGLREASAHNLSGSPFRYRLCGQVSTTDMHTHS